MRIVVFGTGGVGGYFGARLAQAGHDVTFIARGAHLHAMRDHGLHISSVKGDMTVKPVQATDNVADIGTADVVLVATKAWQVPDAAQAIQPIVGPHTMVVPLQNGVEAPWQLVEVLGETPVLGGFCWIVSFIAEPGVIHHTGVEPHVVVGELHNQHTERVQQLAALFKRAHVRVDIADDIQAALWEKFMFIATVSGIGAVTHATVGTMRSLPQTRQMIEQAVHEIIAVGRAHGVALDDAVFDRTMAFIDGMPSHSTLSMQRDIMEGRPSELESQNGAVVRLGEHKSVDTPLNRFLYHSLLPMELQARGHLHA